MAKQERLAAFAYAGIGDENFSVEVCDLDKEEMVAKVLIDRKIYLSLTKKEFNAIIKEAKAEEARGLSRNSESKPNR